MTGPATEPVPAVMLPLPTGGGGHAQSMASESGHWHSMTGPAAEPVPSTHAHVILPSAHSHSMTGSAPAMSDAPLPTGGGGGHAQSMVASEPGHLQVMTGPATEPVPAVMLPLPTGGGGGHAQSMASES